MSEQVNIIHHTRTLGIEITGYHLIGTTNREQRKINQKAATCPEEP